MEIWTIAKTDDDLWNIVDTEYLFDTYEEAVMKIAELASSIDEVELMENIYL